jgi:hypothetical protein
MSRSRLRVARLVAAVGVSGLGAIASVYAVLFAGYLALLTCDEVCDGAPSWHGDGSAWQWRAQFVVALAALWFAVSTPVAIVTGRRARWRAACAVALWGGWLAFLSS